MSRNRKNKATEHKPLIEIPEAEKWRLIRESGLLERFEDSDQSPATHAMTSNPGATDDDGPPLLAEEILNAFMIIIPHTFFLVMMDM